MPMKNAEKFIEKAVVSVLSQTYSELELVIVDDKSTDNSRNIVESIPDRRIKLIDGQGQGIAAAFNLALGSATGYYICRCDADDVYPLNRIELQVKWLKAHPEFGAVCGFYEAIDPDGEIVAQFQNGEEEDITNELLTAKTRTHFCTFLIEKEVIDKLGGCRPYFVTAEDIDLQLRIAELIKVAYIPCNCYQYRIHNSSITHVQSSNKRIFFEELARSFQKQRVMQGQDDLQNGVPPDVPADYGTVKTGNQHVADFLVSASWKLHGKGQKWESIKTGLRACKNGPLDFNMWRNLVVLIIKRS